MRYVALKINSCALVLSSFVSIIPASNAEPPKVFIAEKFRLLYLTVQCMKSKVCVLTSIASTERSSDMFPTQMKRTITQFSEAQLLIVGE